MSTIKKIVFSGVDFEPVDVYRRQLQDFFGDLVNVKGIILDNMDKNVEADLIVVSSEFVKDIAISKSGWRDDKKIIVLKSVFSKKQLAEISNMTKKNAIIVSFYRSYVKESMMIIEESLKQKMNLVPYYQDVKHMAYEEYDYGFFIGEERMIPHGVKKLVNIGWRVISHHTYIQVSKLLEIDMPYINEKIKIHMEDMPDVSFERLQTIQLISENRKIFDKLFDYIIDKGIILLDYDDKIADYNEYICDIFDIKRDVYMNQRIEDVKLFNDIYTPLRDMEENITIDIELGNLSVTGVKKIVRFQHILFQKFLIIEKRKESTKHNRIMAKYTFKDIISVSRPMEKCVHIARKISKTESPILILGETGTGKELFAQALHNDSPRCNKPFIALNCTTLQESLLTSELFGYEKGTFTGALGQGKKGIFEIADGGTVFLDEIGDAPLNVQVELLRVLEEKEIRRIGGEEMIPVNVRVISATNRDLYESVKKDKFRKDLYYRLSAFIIEVPSLKERMDDIRLLTDYFLKKEGYFYKKISPEVYESMNKLEWEGNIRELRNFVNYMGYMSEEIITMDHIPINYKRVLRNKENNTLYSKIQIYFEELDYKDNLIAVEILKIIQYESKGRIALMEKLKKIDSNISQYDIRKILSYLNSKEYISSGKGRKGSAITEKGLDLIKSK